MGTFLLESLTAVGFLISFSVAAYRLFKNHLVGEEKTIYIVLAFVSIARATIDFLYAGQVVDAQFHTDVVNTISPLIVMIFVSTALFYRRELAKVK